MKILWSENSHNRYKELKIELFIYENSKQTDEKELTDNILNVKKWEVLDNTTDKGQSIENLIDMGLLNISKDIYNEYLQLTMVDDTVITLPNDKAEMFILKKIK